MQYQSKVENKCLMTIFEGTDQQKQIDLSPLKEIMEQYQLSELTKVLRDLHPEYSELLLSASVEGSYQAHNNNLEHLTLIKLLKDAFFDICHLELTEDLNKLNDQERARATKEHSFAI